MAHAKFSRRIVAQTVAKKLLTEPAHTSEWLAMAAAYLVTTKQIDKVEQLVQDIARAIQAQSGTLLASVVSAHDLSEELQAKIADSLKQKTGAQAVNLTASVDPALLSGYIVRTPDYELNRTAQHRLRQLMSMEA
jgi:F0F1-type ATP synthase delta subunit